MQIGSSGTKHKEEFHLGKRTGGKAGCEGAYSREIFPRRRPSDLRENAQILENLP